MLRTNAPTPSIEREQVSAGDGELGEMVGTAWVFLRRQYPVILFCAILAIAVAAIYLLVAPPRYTAHTAVILDARKGQFFKEQSILADAPTDMTWVESRVKIVKSDNIAEAVIKTLHLTELPEFVGSGVDALDWLLGFVGASQRPPRSELELIRQAVDIFEKRLEVTRVAMSSVLDVSFISNAPYGQNNYRTLGASDVRRVAASPLPFFMKNRLIVVERAAAANARRSNRTRQ